MVIKQYKEYFDLKGLERISEWGSQNLVNFNASKTQFLAISLSSSPPNNSVFFENIEIFPLHSINILGVQIASNLSWKEHIVQISKSASKKLGVLFRCRNVFSELLKIRDTQPFFSPNL